MPGIEFPLPCIFILEVYLSFYLVDDGTRFNAGMRMDLMNLLLLSILFGEIKLKGMKMLEGAILSLIFTYS